MMELNYSNSNNSYSNSLRHKRKLKQLLALHQTTLANYTIKLLANENIIDYSVDKNTNSYSIKANGYTYSVAIVPTKYLAVRALSYDNIIHFRHSYIVNTKLKAPLIYSLAEIIANKHHKNSLLSLRIKRFLDELRNYLIAKGD